MLAVGGFLVAAGVATAVLRHRGNRPADPEVRVRVVEDVSPTIHIRQLTRPPGVQVRLSVGEPWLNIREVPG